MFAKLKTDTKNKEKVAWKPFPFPAFLFPSFDRYVCRTFWKDSHATKQGCRNTPHMFV
jgi:hypothetical protein